MSDDKLPNSTGKKFVPICAIGASAGGVTALEGLLRQLPMTDLGLLRCRVVPQESAFTVPSKTEPT